MRVARSELVPVGGATPQHTNARGAWSARAGVVVNLVDDNGLIGTGEASPLPGYSRDSLEEAIAALREVLRTPVEVDDRAPLVALRALVSRISPSLPSARFALETALLDLLSRRASVSLGELLRGGPRGPWPEVEVSALLTGDPSSWEDGVLAALLAGHRTVKCKVGASLPEELRALDRLRGLHPHLGLRLDANGTLARRDLPRLFDHFRELSVDLVEEPLSGAALFGLPTLAVPFAIDESLAGAVPEALGSRAAAVVLKLPLLGGVLAARDIAFAAHEAGKRVIVTHVFDGPWALAAACELALSLPFALLPCGLARHGGLSAYPPRIVPQLALEEGSVVAAAILGHGVDPS